MSDDIQSDYDRHEDCLTGRQYKISAEAAFQRSLFKSTANFDKAFDSYSRRNKMLSSMRNGTYRTEIDTYKIAYTSALQLFNIVQASLLVFAGFWLAILFTIPAIAALNYYFLHKDRGY